MILQQSQGQKHARHASTAFRPLSECQALAGLRRKCTPWQLPHLNQAREVNGDGVVSGKEAPERTLRIPCVEMVIPMDAACNRVGAIITLSAMHMSP
eukprot:347918-Chlamydomonas_euryale.AAC.2